MAVHLSIGRNLSISLVALVGLALVTGADHFLSRPVPPGEATGTSTSAATWAGSRPSWRPSRRWRGRKRGSGNRRQPPAGQLGFRRCPRQLKGDLAHGDA